MTDFPPHTCDVLEPHKISSTRTELRCVICDKVVGTWEDKIRPDGRQEYSAELEEQMR